MSGCHQNFVGSTGNLNQWAVTLEVFDSVSLAREPRAANRDFRSTLVWPRARGLDGLCTCAARVAASAYPDGASSILGFRLGLNLRVIG